jgi:hypothetical protein
MIEKSLARKILSLVTLLAFSPMLMAMDKQYLNFWEILECQSENIELEGSVRFQFHETGKGWVFQAFWTGDGWGHDSGDEYKITGKWTEVVQEKRPFIMYWNDHFQLVGKGEAPNYRFYSRIRFIVDEYGVWVPEFVDDEWPCPTIDSAIW